MKCTFCRIINEEEKAFTIYSSDYVMAFLDKYPVSRGHTLVVPKEHYETIFETPDRILYELIRIAKKIATAQMKILHADGVRILQNNGKAARQEYHIYIFT